MGAALSENNADDVRATLPSSSSWRSARCSCPCGWPASSTPGGCRAPAGSSCGPSSSWASPSGRAPSRTTPWRRSRCCTPPGASRCRCGSVGGPDAGPSSWEPSSSTPSSPRSSRSRSCPCPSSAARRCRTSTSWRPTRWGGPEHVDRIAEAFRLADDPDAVIITSNYGEAGAVDRFGPALGLPAPHSGQNDLGTLPGRPRAPARRWSSGTRGRRSRTCSRRARSWPGSTTARACPTRSRTPRRGVHRPPAAVVTDLAALRPPRLSDLPRASGRGCRPARPPRPPRPSTTRASRAPARTSRTVMTSTDSAKASAPPGSATAYVGIIRPGIAVAASMAPTAPSQLPTMLPRCAWMRPRRALTTPSVTVTRVDDREHVQPAGRPRR